MSSSRSRSKSPGTSAPGVVEFITSFGGDSDTETAVVQGPSLPPTTASPTMHRKTFSKSRSVLPRLRNDRLCVEWDVKPYTQSVLCVCFSVQGGSKMLKVLAMVIRTEDGHAEFRLSWNVYSISVNSEF